MNWRISSRHTCGAPRRNELVLKDVGGQYLHSDAADRLHLRWCGSQKSKESQRAVLAIGRKNVRLGRSLLRNNWMIFSTEYVDWAYWYNPMHGCAAKRAQKSL